MHSTIHRATAAVAVLSLTSAAAAQLVVTQDLGTVGPGVIDLVGDTSLGNNNTDTYLFPFPGDGSTFNYGNELVYQFTTTEPLVLSATIQSATEDPDFFFLDDLAVQNIGGKLTATGLIPAGPVGDPSPIFFLDNPPGDLTVYGLLQPDTYFLSATSNIGFDSSVTPGLDATFDIDLILDPVAAPTATDIGVIANVGEAINLNTFGSTFDTLIGLFDADGNLIEQNDDAGSGFQSEIDLPGGLAAGDYFLTIGDFSTVLLDGFVIAPGSDESGDFVFDYGVGTANGSIGLGETTSFKFTVAIPEPASLSLLAPGALLLLRRRA